MLLVMVGGCLKISELEITYSNGNTTHLFCVSLCSEFNPSKNIGSESHSFTLLNSSAVQNAAAVGLIAQKSLAVRVETPQG